MKRIIISATEKGGVGKSFCFVQMVQWLRTHPEGVRLAVFDPDYSNRTLKKHFDDMVEEINPEKSSDLDGLIRAAMSEDVDISIMDGLGSQHSRVVQAWVDTLGLFELAAETGVRITYCLVLDDGQESVSQGWELFKKIGSKVDWLIIYNPAKESDKQLQNWTESEFKKSVDASIKKGAKNIAVIEMANLKENALGHIWHLIDACKLSVGEMLDKNSERVPEKIKNDVVTQHRIKKLWERISSQFQAAEHVILPAA